MAGRYPRRTRREEKKCLVRDDASICLPSAGERRANRGTRNGAANLFAELCRAKRLIFSHLSHRSGLRFAVAGRRMNSPLLYEPPPSDAIHTPPFSLSPPFSHRRLLVTAVYCGKPRYITSIWLARAGERKRFLQKELVHKKLIRS